MYNNHPNYSQPPQNGQGQKKQIINQWQGIGVVKPRGNSQQITFYPFQNGGGAIHFNICCTEYTGFNDEYGNPKFRQDTIPVTVRTNKTISVQMLQSIAPEMKVRVVGSWRNKTVNSKKTGQPMTINEVEAFVVEILEAPTMMQQYQQPQPQYQQPHQQRQYQEPQYQQPHQQPQFQQPQFQQPQYQEPQYQEPQPQYQPQYQPQALPQPQGGQRAPQYAKQTRQPSQIGPNDDLPPGNFGGPQVRDIDI